MNFNDAVVAIAITLLVLPLVDAAGSIGSTGVGPFLHDNRTRLFAFFLSFVVIGNFWYTQHQTLERVDGYDAVLVTAILFWLLSIVFLPFPTELIGSAKRGVRAADSLYIGTLLATNVASLLEQWRIVRRPELQAEDVRGQLTLHQPVLFAGLLVVAFVLSLLIRGAGLWSLVILIASRPVAALLARGHHGAGHRRETPPA